MIPYKDIQKAIIQDNEAEIVSLIEQGVDPNEIFMEAVGISSENIVKFLLSYEEELKLDFNYIRSFGSLNTYSLLYFLVVQAINNTFFKNILKNNIDKFSQKTLSHRDPYFGNTPLLRVVKQMGQENVKNGFEIAELLVSKMSKDAIELEEKNGGDVHLYVSFLKNAGYYFPTSIKRLERKIYEKCGPKEYNYGDDE